MNIAIDISPFKTGNYLAHQVRGSGIYLTNLLAALEKYYPQHAYLHFWKEKEIPKNADIVHYPYFEPFFPTLPLFFNYPTVVTIHDLIPLLFPQHFPAGLRGNLSWQKQKYSLRKVKTILTDSESSKKDIASITGYLKNNIAVVYLAASPGFKRSKDRHLQDKVKKKYTLPAQFILYVGDVTWNKNLPRLIKAVKKINKSQNGKISLVMVGKALVDAAYDRSNAWNRDLVTIQELIREDPYIITLGFVEQEDLVCMYSLATLMILPSLYEGFGLPILEAMRCGCPVITTKRGSLPEVGGDAVLYTEPEDEQAIINAIQMLFYDEKLQQRLSKKGYEQAEQFTWKKTAEQTMAVYEKIH